MATPKTLFPRPLPRPATRAVKPNLQPSIQHQYQHQHQQHRTFLPNPFSSSSSHATPQTFSARRTLPYPSAPVYSIIADVPNYATFLPYCSHSSITAWSSPDPTYHRRWPSVGILTSGYGNITESFASRVYCVPGRVVESVGGATETSLDKGEIVHHTKGEDSRDGVREGGQNRLLTHLRSKWTVEEVAKDRTRVELVIEYAFANPLYAALSGGVAPKVADFMIKAFEKRVQELLEKSPGMATATLAELDGSQLKR